jgi:CheY-like chemotaxis protein
MAKQPITSQRILLVEDEYMIAMDMEHELRSMGRTVLGPVPSLDEAQQVADSEPRIDLAILDLNLGGERAYPLADKLIDRGVPLIFITGYDESTIPERYSAIPRYSKPITRTALQRALTTGLDGPSLSDNLGDPA